MPEEASQAKSWPKAKPKEGLLHQCFRCKSTDIRVDPKDRRHMCCADCNQDSWSVAIYFPLIPKVEPDPIASVSPTPAPA